MFIVSGTERTAESRGHRPGDGGEEQSCVSPGTTRGEVCPPHIENSPFIVTAQEAAIEAVFLNLLLRFFPHFKLLMADVHDKVRGNKEEYDF